MKVTSLKSVETYIYSSVILPLKGLNIPPLDYASPITGKNGNQWLLMVRQAEIRDYRRQYQRTQAQRKANWNIILYNGTTEYVVGDYIPKTHVVKLYERPFRRLAAMPLLGKLYEAFYRNTPFTKVVTEIDTPKRQYFVPRRPRLRGYDIPQPDVWADAPDETTITQRDEEVPF